MRRKTTTENKHGRRYPVPLSKAAPLLSVSRVHLSLVLNQHRSSDSLTRRYAALVRQLCPPAKRPRKSAA